MADSNRIGRTVLKVLATHVSDGEIADGKRCIPADNRQ